MREIYRRESKEKQDSSSGGCGCVIMLFIMLLSMAMFLSPNRDKYTKAVEHGLSILSWVSLALTVILLLFIMFYKNKPDNKVFVHMFFLSAFVTINTFIVPLLFNWLIHN